MDTTKDTLPTTEVMRAIEELFGSGALFQFIDYLEEKEDVRDKKSY